MEDKCRYCLHVKDCSNRCEYGSLICAMNRQIPKDVENSYVSLQQENKQLREKLDKINKWFQNHQNQTVDMDGMIVKETHIYEEILNIIKEG